MTLRCQTSIIALGRSSPTGKRAGKRGERRQIRNGVDTQTKPIRVLVADDYDLFRTGLASMLGGEADMDVVAQASGGRAAVRLASELQPDVVLMDLRMPDMTGAEATRKIVSARPETRVVVFTVLSDDSDVEEAMRAGACGFLGKDTPIEEVMTAIRAAARGVAWLSPAAAEVVLSHVRQGREELPADDEGGALSPRELDVLQLIARGLDNAAIAETLGISPRTAKNHVSSILAKLGIPSRIQAAIYAVRHGLG